MFKEKKDENSSGFHISAQENYLPVLLGFSLLRHNNAISQRVAALSLLFQLLHWLLIGKQAFLCIIITVGVCQNTGC